MGAFPCSFGNECILLAVDYVYKWVEAVPTRTTEARVIAKFLRKNIFSRYGIPRAIISNQGTHFDNRSFDTLLKKCSITRPYSSFVKILSVHLLQTLTRPYSSTRGNLGV